MAAVGLAIPGRLARHRHRAGGIGGTGARAPAREVGTMSDDVLIKRTAPAMKLRAINPFYAFTLGLAVVLLVWALFLND
jgi:hypothetical protein